jgi:hypothetical protein
LRFGFDAISAFFGLLASCKSFLIISLFSLDIYKVGERETRRRKKKRRKKKKKKERRIKIKIRLALK